ncbi:MAG: glycosyltransferase family 1 protein [Nakamurella sp.]
MTNPEAGAAQRALASRLRAVAPILLSELPELVPAAAEDAARVLTSIAGSLTADPANHRVWLTLAGISAAFPTRDDVDQVRRRLELSDPDEAAAFLLDFGLTAVQDSGAPLATVQVVVGGVLVDVDFTSRHELHTGIQRVVRQTVPIWNRDRDITAVAWTTARGAFRPLDPDESARIFDWADAPASSGQPLPAPDDNSRLVLIPWQSVVVLPEVPAVDVTPRIAAIGACSNNSVVAIGHDAIPLISAETLDIEEPRKFMSYLSALKFASCIAGVSRSSTREFAGFGSMLSSQGLPAPRTIAITLPAEFSRPDGPAAATQETPAANPPDVVVVGSHDTRKNHLAVLQAAEKLWREGLAFRLTFIGGGGSNLEFQRRIEVLMFHGRPVELRTAVSDQELKAAVSTARFTVFPSLHEGYGLPVAESMALGTPVITTDYGATAEIAEGGGAVTVDPRDDAALTGAMRRLLTDDAEITRLRAEIRRRAGRSWQSYADELWNCVIGPALDDVARTPFHEEH